MGKPTVPPTCKYHNVQMKPVVMGDGSLVSYAAVNTTESMVNLGRVYQFNIYECPSCTYLEFHDFDPVKK